MITPEDIKAQLDRIKQNKQRQGYMSPAAYKDFMPKTLGFEPRDTSLMFQHLNSINQHGVNATNLVRVKAKNTRDYNEMIRRRKELHRARGLLNASYKAEPSAASFFGNYHGGRNWGKKWGRDNTPEVSDLNSIHASGPLSQVNWRGRSFTVNRQVAPIFVSFLDDLKRSGYKPVSIGGYSNRNIAGTNTKSLHSYGLAIDIDPGKNPVTYGKMHTALPPGVGALAAKYGLSWGGSWNSYKDPMHFSVAWGGRE